MRIKNPQKVLEKRMELERELIEKYSASVDDLAIYFETTPSIIRRDLRGLGLEPGSGNESAIEALVQCRNEEIVKIIGKDSDEDTVLMNYGLWRKLRRLDDIKLFKPLINNLVLPANKKKKIIVLLELGWSLDDVIKVVNGLSNAERKIILGYIHQYKLTPKYVKENDEEMNSIVKETLQYEYQKSVEREEAYRTFRAGIFKSILNLTGASETMMYEFLGKESYADKRRQILKDRKNLTRDNNSKQIEDKILKIEIYKAWKKGIVTKNEIADTIGVTRQTIYNWISDMEIKEQLNLKNDYLICNNIELQGFINPNSSNRIKKFYIFLKEKSSLKEENLNNLEVNMEDINENRTEKRMLG